MGTATATSEDGSFVVSSGVRVSEAQPQLAIGPIDTVPAGTPFTVAATFSDMGGDDVTGWVIDWGDGSAVEIPGVGGDSPPAFPSHSYKYGDTAYDVTVAATTEDGVFNATQHDETPVAFIVLTVTRYWPSSSH